MDDTNSKIDEIRADLRLAGVPKSHREDLAKYINKLLLEVRKSEAHKSLEFIRNLGSFKRQQARILEIERELE